MQKQNVLTFTPKPITVQLAPHLIFTSKDALLTNIVSYQLFNGLFR